MGVDFIAHRTLKLKALHRQLSPTVLGLKNVSRLFCRATSDSLWCKASKITSEQKKRNTKKYSMPDGRNRISCLWCWLSQSRYKAVTGERYGETLQANEIFGWKLLLSECLLEAASNDALSSLYRKKCYSFSTCGNPSHRENNWRCFEKRMVSFQLMSTSCPL